MLIISTDTDSNLLTVKASGKLTKEDYDDFVPEVDKLIKRHGKIRVLFEMEDFHGWEAAALWQDTKFDLQHFSDIERIAFVGDKKWEMGMALFCKPFTTAEIRFFSLEEYDQALAWVRKEEPATDSDNQ